MKIYKILCALSILIFCLGTSSGQVSLHANAGGGMLFLNGGYNNYMPGYRIQAGLTVGTPIPIVEDLSWEAGVEAAIGQAKFYRMERGTHVVLDGNFPLDKSQKLTHKLRFLDVPFRLRYNAFGFMGLMAGVNLSFTLDRKIYIPDEDKLTTAHFDNNFITTAEAGLFFPITDRLRIDAKIYQGLDARFFLSHSITADGKDDYGGAYRDFGLLLNFAYRLNR